MFLSRSHRTEFKIEDDQTSQIISFINRYSSLEANLCQTSFITPFLKFYLLFSLPYILPKCVRRNRSMAPCHQFSWTCSIEIIVSFIKCVHRQNLYGLKNCKNVPSFYCYELWFIGTNHKYFKHWLLQKNMLINKIWENLQCRFTHIIFLCAKI